MSTDAEMTDRASTDVRNIFFILLWRKIDLSRVS